MLCVWPLYRCWSGPRRGRGVILSDSSSGAQKRTKRGGGVCVILYFYTATCGPKGHGSGGFFQKDLFLSPIEMINPSGAPLSPSSHDPPEKGKER